MTGSPYIQEDDTYSTGLLLVINSLRVADNQLCKLTTGQVNE